jgi:predicted ArsR family transcriptional regulator
MQRRRYHPDAYLERRRNVIRGLQARTKILEVMDRASAQTIQEVASLTVLSYSASRHHLRLLEAERIVKRTGKRPYRWRLTGKGQKRLLDHVDDRCV